MGGDLVGFWVRLNNLIEWYRNRGCLSVFAQLKLPIISESMARPVYTLNEANIFNLCVRHLNIGNNGFMAMVARPQWIFKFIHLRTLNRAQTECRPAIRPRATQCDADESIETKINLSIDRAGDARHGDGFGLKTTDIVKWWWERVVERARWRMERVGGGFALALS